MLTGKKEKKNSYIFSKTKILVRTVSLLEISLMSGLIGDSWILRSTSAFNLLQYVIFVKICEGNPALQHTYLEKKEVFE